MTWANKGNNVHSVVASSGVAPAFDSGGLGPGQSFVWTPAAAGTDGYHSTTDASYVTEPVCNCNAASYGAFAATIIVGT